MRARPIHLPSVPLRAVANQPRSVTCHSGAKPSLKPNEENALPPAEAEASRRRTGTASERAPSSRREQSLAARRVERHEALEQAADVA